MTRLRVPARMTKRQRAQVVELLETAHGYAVMGSLLPFMSACVDLGLRGSETAKIASAAIDLARDDLRLASKPSAPDYERAILLALERAEETP